MDLDLDLGSVGPTLFAGNLVISHSMFIEL